MTEFRLSDSNIFEMKGTGGLFYHLGTIQYELREFICIVNRMTHECYIEEITGGHLSFIEDDSLALSLSKFADEKRIIDMGRFHTYLTRNDRPVYRKTD